MNLLQQYLPRAGAPASPYSEGGALYALGMIHSNRAGGADGATTAYLVDAIKNAGNDEMLQHGGCLGLGLAAMSTGDAALYQELNNVLLFDSAVAGQAAALGIGLVFLGTGTESPVASEAVTELLAYAHETAHEKIIRGAAVGVSLVMAGQEQRADPLIDQLRTDRDPIFRYGAAHTIGLAYVGTANNSAVQRLLHMAVSDVSDDVRRAAVTNLGLVMHEQPEKLIQLVALLAESFNAHVRYGASLAVGIACAGSGSVSALALIEPMLKDRVDYVRQMAYISMAMVLSQRPESDKQVETFTATLNTVITEKHQTVLAKTGAILAKGILSAGGQNMCISLSTKQGKQKLQAAAGIAVWSQFWFWYPLKHFLALSLSPTFMVGLNKDLDVPTAFAAKCAAAPSQFAYATPLKEDDGKEKDTMATATLSTSAKAKARDIKKGKGDAAAAVEKEKAAEADKATEDGAKAKEASKPKVPEPTEYMLSNPARITRCQADVVTVGLGQRHVPVAPSGSSVFVLMDTDVDGAAPDVVKLEPIGDGSPPEASAPADFVWTPE